MGKWTPDYLDDVLHAKVSSLVTGAIRRAAVEKEPTISYENFVNELDLGDSFTTSLIDILVKELAERRTRPSINDRRLIADRTAKSLRLLATPLRVYRERPTTSRIAVGRRPINLTDTFVQNELDMDDDEDEFDSVLDTATIEGARVNSELYDAFGAGWPSITRRIVASPSPLSDEGTTSAPPPLRSPPTASRPAFWTMQGTTGMSSSNLTRQSSIRRPVRSRTVDFNDFTHRRRSSIRESLGSTPRPEASEVVTEPREGTWVRPPRSESARRFFPFTRTRRHESPGSLPWSDILNADAEDAMYEEPSISGSSWNFVPTTFSGVSPPHGIHHAETSDERVHAAAPRLRRGGLRAPESMMSRHTSPIIVNTTPADTNISPNPSSPRREDNDIGPANSEPVAYPTPGSIENENVS